MATGRARRFGDLDYLVLRVPRSAEDEAAVSRICVDTELRSLDVLHAAEPGVNMVPHPRCVYGLERFTGWYLPEEPPPASGCRLQRLALWSIDAAREEALSRCPLREPVETVEK